MSIYKFLFNTMKKKQTKKRRSHKGLSAPARKRHTKRRSKGLGDIFNPTLALNSAKNTLAGGAGGLGAMITAKSILPSDSGKLMKVGTGLVGAFLLGAFGMPALGAGFAGGMTAISFPNGLLGEEDNANFADDEALNEPAIFLNDEGQPMMLQEANDGSMSWRYLSEDEMAEYEQVLNEGGTYGM